MSFIPPLCTDCGERLARMSNVNPNVQCLNYNCKTEFVLARVEHE